MGFQRLSDVIYGLISHSNYMKLIYDNFSVWKDSVHCVFVRLPHIHCDVLNISTVTDFLKTLDDCFLVTVWLDVINSPAFNISQYKPRSTDNMYLVYPKPLRSFKLVFTFFECHIVLKNVPNSFLVNTNAFCDFYK